MPAPDLCPLSLGEILDRTFSLYRRNFLLFVGITAIPQLFVLVMQLTQLLMAPVGSTGKLPRTNLMAMGALGIVTLLVGFIVYIVA